VADGASTHNTLLYGTLLPLACGTVHVPEPMHVIRCPDFVQYEPEQVTSWPDCVHTSPGAEPGLAVPTAQITITSLGATLSTGASDPVGGGSSEAGATEAGEAGVAVAAVSRGPGARRLVAAVELTVGG
jgi:hypothetical protein